MENRASKIVWIIIRLLMASMFVESYIDKLHHWDNYLEETIAKGIPFPVFGLSMAAATEVIGSTALITGVYIRLGAFILAGYVFVLGFFYFDFWNLDGLAATMALKEFLKDFAVIAGLLLIAVMGMDNKFLRANSPR
jgi:putative oxidoreductase